MCAERALGPVFEIRKVRRVCCDFCFLSSPHFATTSSAIFIPPDDKPPSQLAWTSWRRRITKRTSRQRPRATLFSIRTRVHHPRKSQERDEVRVSALADSRKQKLPNKRSKMQKTDANLLMFRRLSPSFRPISRRQSDKQRAARRLLIDASLLLRRPRCIHGM